MTLMTDVQWSVTLPPEDARQVVARPHGGSGRASGAELAARSTAAGALRHWGSASGSGSEPDSSVLAAGAATADSDGSEEDLCPLDDSPLLQVGP
jgi:hypothetical protein